MNIFISWSGERSKAVAIFLADWLRCTIQATRPWVSSRNLERGSLWFNVIYEKLSECSVGVVCLTPENQSKPWILFESGALAKGIISNKLFTFLIDLQPNDVIEPLNQFNHTMPTGGGIMALLETINSGLMDPLPASTLQSVFDTYWPRFEDGYKKILDSNPVEDRAPLPDRDDLVRELLGSIRTLGLRLNSIENEIINNNSVNKLIIRNEPLRDYANNQIRSLKPSENVFKDLIERGASTREAEIILKDVIKRYHEENL